MKKAEVIRGICFLALLAVVFQLLTTISIPKWYGTWQSTRIVDGFYEMPKDSLDVVLLGSSQTIMGLSGMELYQRYGISAYGFGTEEQPIYATYYWLMEILRFQNPKVVVLDVNEILHESQEAAYRKAFDYMKWSSVKWDAITTHCEENEELSLLSYLLPLTNYHNRWDELESADFTYLTSDKSDPYLGYVVSHGTCEILYEGTPFDPSDEPDPADPEAYEYLLKIIQLCKEKNLELLFVKTPRAGWNPSKHNLVAQIADEADVPFLDFNDIPVMQEMQFDYPMNARDGSHLNIYGAEKIGEYLGAYLVKEYGLSDHRGEVAYSYLEEMSDLYTKQTENAKLVTCENFSTWADAIQDRYVVFLTLRADANAGSISQIREILMQIGVSPDVLEKNAGYAAILQNGNALTEQTGAEIVDFSGMLENGTVYTLNIPFPSDDEAEQEQPCSMIISLSEQVQGDEGICLAVYDSVDEEIIDSVRIDPTDPELFLLR